MCLTFAVGGVIIVAKHGLWPRWGFVARVWMRYDYSLRLPSYALTLTGRVL